MRQTLTERQNEAFEFVRSYMRDHQMPPTIKEIGQALGISSTNGVAKHLVALEKKGYISRRPRAARGLSLIGSDSDSFALDGGPPTVPVMSRTSSNRPDTLRNRPAGYFRLDPYFLQSVRSSDACLIGRSADDGMNPVGIRKGDFLVIEERAGRSLQSGDMAAFLVGEELRARYLFRRGGAFHLRPADRRYSEDAFSPEDPGCYPVGKIIAILRRL